jgi:phage/plasmid-like protein (TIGR03299 family)
MTHNIDSMAYYGEKPWHGLGTHIPERANALEMICAAGLDWEVEMRPIRNAGVQADEKARRCHLIRMPRSSDGIEVPLGVVSSRYLVLQNREAFGFFDPVIGDNKGVFETAGALGNGERIWVLAKVPGEIRVIGDDICSKYLLLSNAHDGRGSVSVKFTPIRVVCQNTLMLALESGEKAHTIRHSKHMQVRLQNAQELLSLIWNTFERAAELFQLLAKVSVDAKRLDTYLEAVYPRTEDQRKAQRRPERWGRVAQLYEVGDSPDLRPSHSLWGAYNSVTRYEDYRHANEAGQDRRLNRVWFGQGADLKLHALQQADALRRQWLT